jgi:GNAT superfamily N-acetyltransferase
MSRRDRLRDGVPLTVRHPEDVPARLLAPTTVPAVLTPTLARDVDAESLLALREAAAQWLASLGVLQWEPGEVSLEQIRSQVREGQWWVLEGDDRLRGALRVLTADPDAWGRQAEATLYVHGLVIAREETGAGLGAGLLRWVEALAVRRGVRLVRLDCVESNERLRAYYKNQGFTEVGRATFHDPPWYPAVLLEKRLT